MTALQLIGAKNASRKTKTFLGITYLFFTVPWEDTEMVNHQS